jgi:hypothetical protein
LLQAETSLKRVKSFDILSNHIAAGPRAQVHLAICNEPRGAVLSRHPTHDGVDRGGARLAAEIESIVKVDWSEEETFLHSARMR